MEEMFDVYTKEGEFLGTRPASVCRSENPGFYYKVVWTIILNEDNEILIQKRSNNIATYKNLWEFSSSGHVDHGETEIDACIREAKEELGVNLSKENIKHINTFVHGNQLAYTYITRIRNNTSFTLQKDEVSEVKYVNLYDFKNYIYSKDFIPREKEYYEFLLNYFINTLKMDDRNIIRRNVNEDNLVKSMDSITNDNNVKEGIELEGSLRIIDITITILILLLIGIVIYSIIKK